VAVFPKKSCSNKKLEHEAGELIERVGQLQAHDNKGRDHQICAEMHEEVKPKISFCLVDGAAKLRTLQRWVRCLTNPAFLKRNLPPPRKYCLCREPLLARKSLVRRQLLLTHVPWKIFTPHSTTTMANTSVAAVNTSKEATLIL
jgi:hypothetical protein